MFKLSALSVAVAGALGVTSMAYAVDTSAPEGEAGARPSTPIEEVLVTGSRIVRDGYFAPTPVTTAAVDDLLKAQPTNIPDGLNKLPQFQMSSSPSRSVHNYLNTASHGNLLNLRGVGSKRTLILLDGQRMPKTTFLGDVDVNVLPNLLMERTEIVTGGASAAYGSDAVSGAVNFILDKNFTGVKGVVQGGRDGEGDNEHHRLGIAGGFEWADGRGHTLLSAERFRSDGMDRADRSASRAGWTYVGSNPNCVSPIAGACSPGGSANPFVVTPNVKLNASNQRGVIVASPEGFPYQRYRFADGNTVVPFDQGALTGTPGFSQGGDGYQVPIDVTAVSPLDTDQFFARTQFDFSPTLTGHVQAIASRSEVSYRSMSNAWTGVTNAPIFSGNPYLPDTLQNALNDGEMISVGIYDEVGPKPLSEERTDFWMISGGLEGEVGNGWRWNMNLSHGDSQHDAQTSGLYEWQKAYAAVDAVYNDAGQIVCRPSLSSDPAIAARFADCSPMNVMGVDPAVATPEGYAYASGTSRYKANNEMTHISFDMSGSPFSMPAGEVDVAFGAEYRREKLKLRSNADPALLETPEQRAEHFAGLRGVAPSALYYWLTNIGIADGSVNVKELFFESNIPLLADVPGARNLDLNLAGRYTDYSTSGDVNTWKVGLSWNPVDDIRFRGTVSRDIRAPTLYELYAGDASNITNVFDPVSGIQGNLPQIVGGNSNLKPEEADTLTVGMVVTPSMVPGLSFSLDYYSIEIDEAIGQLSAPQIVTNCFNAGAGAPECALITRPSPGEFPTSLRVAPANIAYLETSGLDLDVSYSMQAGPGDLSLRLYANYLLDYKTLQYAGAPEIDWAGIGAVYGGLSEGRPELTGMFNIGYTVNDFSVFVSQQYIGSLELAVPGAPSNFVDGKVKEQWYTDLTMSYDFAMSGGQLTLFGTVNNLFDKSAPLIPMTVPGLAYPTINSVYDFIGRSFTAGVRFEF